MRITYSLRYFFEWGGSCLWTNNAAARHRFGISAVELDDLPLSDATKRCADELVAWHDQSINPNYPPDPSLWRQDECDRFNKASKQLLETIRSELGDDYEVIDRQRLLREDPELNQYLAEPKRFRRS